MRRILRKPDTAAAPAAILEDAFARAGGNVARAQQLLAHEQDLEVPYSILTRWIRQAGLRHLTSPPVRRCSTTLRHTA